MGNYVSRRPSGTATGKVILPDGTVRVFDQPVSVAELMLEHPHQVVMEFRSLLHGAKPTPLPADHKLDFKKVYLMMPMTKRGKDLSAAEARQFLSRSRSVLRSWSSPSLRWKLPLISAGMCRVARIAEGAVEGDLSRKDGVGLEEKRPDEEVNESRLPEPPPESLGEMPEYLLSRQLSSGWKPSLHTIVEKGLERKISHWLF